MAPGFRSLRSPARFGIAASFALSLLAAYGFAHEVWKVRKAG